jgi:hypothetical protein
MSWIKDNVDQTLIDYLFNIRIDDIPNYGAYQRNIAEDLPIDFERLEIQLEETPEQIAFWSMLLANQKSKVAVLERRIKTIRGKAVERLLTEARQTKCEYRTTEIKELLNMDPSILQLDSTLLAQQKVLLKLEVTVDAFRLKLDALRSLAGFKKVDKSAQRGH